MSLATAFGVTQVSRVELVFGDWYHTAEREQLIEKLPLDGSATTGNRPP